MVQCRPASACARKSPPRGCTLKKQDKTRQDKQRWFKCMRPEHPAHGGVTLCTVQCRPALACARKSPRRGCTLKKQDKTRQAQPCEFISRMTFKSFSSATSHQRRLCAALWKCAKRPKPNENTPHPNSTQQNSVTSLLLLKCPQFVLILSFSNRCPWHCFCWLI